MVIFLRSKQSITFFAWVMGRSSEREKRREKKQMWTSQSSGSKEHFNSTISEKKSPLHLIFFSLLLEPLNSMRFFYRYIQNFSCFCSVCDERRKNTVLLLMMRKNQCHATMTTTLCCFFSSSVAKWQNDMYKRSALAFRISHEKCVIGTMCKCAE